MPEAPNIHFFLSFFLFYSFFMINFLSDMSHSSKKKVLVKIEGKLLRHPQENTKMLNLKNRNWDKKSLFVDQINLSVAGSIFFQTIPVKWLLNYFYFYTAGRKLLRSHLKVKFPGALKLLCVGVWEFVWVCVCVCLCSVCEWE